MYHGKNNYLGSHCLILCFPGSRPPNQDWVKIGKLQGDLRNKRARKRGKRRQLMKDRL